MKPAFWVNSPKISRVVQFKVTSHQFDVKICMQYFHMATIHTYQLRFIFTPVRPFCRNVNKFTSRSDLVIYVS